MINVNFNEFDKFISCRVGSMSCGGHVNIVCLHSLFKLLKFFLLEHLYSFSCVCAFICTSHAEMYIWNKRMVKLSG